MFLGISKLASDSSSFFFFVYAVKSFIKINEKEVEVNIMCIKFFKYLPYYK